MSKKNKSSSKANNQYGFQDAYQPTASTANTGNTAANTAAQAVPTAAPTGSSAPAFLQNLSTTQQFLLGAAAGAAVAYVLSDAELRHKIVRSGFKLYGSVAGGWEEMKEQVSDIKAEIQSEV